MLESRNLEGLRYFLELGLLFPAVTERLRGRIMDSRLVASFLRNAAPRPELRVRGLLLLAGHYRRCGFDGDADNLVTACQGGWHSKLRAADTGNTASFLRDLARFDPDSADQVVGDNLEWLRHRVRRCYREPGLAVDILVATVAASRSHGERMVSDLQREPRSWRMFLDGLAHEQDPRQQARGFRRLARLGVVPGADAIMQDIMQKVHNRWRGESGISTIASPAALTELLGMFRAWDLVTGEDSAVAAAQLVDLKLTSARLVETASGDLEFAGSLISALHLAGQERKAHELAKALPRNSLTRLDVPTTSRLAGVLFLIDAGLASELLNNANDRIQHALRYPVVIDEEAHWTALGWLAYHARVTGAPIALPPRAPTLELARAPALRAWAHGWFAGQTSARELEALPIAGMSPTEHAQIVALKAHHGAGIADNELRSALAVSRGQIADPRTLHLMLTELRRAGRDVPAELRAAVRDRLRRRSWDLHAAHAVCLIDRAAGGEAGGRKARDRARPRVGDRQ